MPVPDIVQETGTVMFISSTTEVLSSAETVLDASMVPVSIVILASVVMDNSNIAIGSCGLVVDITLELMYSALSCMNLSYITIVP